MMFKRTVSVVLLTVLSLAFLSVHADARTMRVKESQFEGSLTARQLVDQLDRRQIITQFGEVQNARHFPIINIKPTFEPSDLRLIQTTTNGGSISNNDQNLIELETGTNTGGTAEIETQKNGQYQADAIGLFGTAIWTDNPEDINGDQEATWGNYSDTDGFGFGVNDTGVFVFNRKNGNDTKVYQTDWNQDTLDSSLGDNPSGNTLDLTHGNIFRVEYHWYGSGDAVFWIDVSDDQENDRDLVPVHRMTFRNDPSLTNPNNPLGVDADNGGEGSTLVVEVGAMQFGVIAGERSITNREVNDFVEQHEITSNSSTWEPILAVRRKDTLNGNTNSLRAEILNASVTGYDAPVTFKVTASDTVSGATFESPTDWGSESAMEVSTNPNGFTADVGLPFIRDYVAVATGGPSTVSKASISRANVPVGQERIIVLWVRNTTDTNATVSAVLKWEEFW